MALQGTLGTKDKDGVQVPVFTAEFTNGTLEQLRELATFLKEEEFALPEAEDEKLKAVVEIAIGWLERIKNRSNDKADSAGK